MCTCAHTWAPTHVHSRYRSLVTCHGKITMLVANRFVGIWHQWVSEWLSFNSILGDSGHQGPCSPYICDNHVTSTHQNGSVHIWSTTMNLENLYTLWPFHVNWLWHSDSIWRQRSGSTLAQVRACCLTAPSHYLNQYWLNISKVWWHSFAGTFTRDTSAINH